MMFSVWLAAFFILVDLEFVHDDLMEFGYHMLVLWTIIGSQCRLRTLARFRK